MVRESKTFSTRYIKERAERDPEFIKTYEYLKAIENGFNCYGLNGFYEMHKDVSDKKETAWEGELEILNEVTYKEFVTLASLYLKGRE